MEHNQNTLRTGWCLYISCAPWAMNFVSLYVCNMWKWQVPKPERHLNTQTYVIFIGCLCSMWLRSGTSEIWHWRWNLLCSYQDRRQRSNKHTQKKNNKEHTYAHTQNSAELIACSGLLCVLGAGAGGARAHWSPAEARDWSVYRRSANLSGGGMWLWCYFPQSAEGPASGEFLIFWGVLIGHQFPNPYRLFLFLQAANQIECQTSLCSFRSFFHLNESINTFLISEKSSGKLEGTWIWT